MFFFFFSSRRRHTRLQGDWSSDVCSSDLRELGNYPALKEPTKYPVDTSGFEWPPKDRSAVHVVRGPNIAPLPVAAPPKDTIEGEVLLRLGDNISTDHIMPAGAKILPLRSNIP